MPMIDRECQESDRAKPKPKVIIGVDVALYGDTPTKIAVRREGEKRSLPVRNLARADLDVTVGEIVRTFRQHSADVVAVQGTGIGAGVIDHLRHAGIPVREIPLMSVAEMLTFLPEFK